MINAANRMRWPKGSAAYPFHRVVERSTCGGPGTPRVCGFGFEVVERHGSRVSGRAGTLNDQVGNVDGWHFQDVNQYVADHVLRSLGHGSQKFLTKERFKLSSFARMDQGREMIW